MSVYDMWVVCDRCSFEYRRKQMRKEASGLLVCRSCNDGRFDRIRHPQNKPPPARLELRMVPDARPPINLSYYLAQENLGLILQENDGPLEGSEAVWTPAMSAYR